MKPRPRFLAWPGWPLLCEAIVLGAAQALWWVFVYFGADWVTGLRSERMRVHLAAELKVPLIPEFLLVYLSLDLLFLIAPFVLRTRAEIRALTCALFGVTSVAGVCFLLLPAELAYPAGGVEGFWSDLFVLNRQIVLRYNLIPSLHVALSTVILAAYGNRRGAWGRILLAAWGGLIGLSTLLTHQHHVVDVVTGLLLGWAGYQLLYRHWLDAAVARNAPASPSSNREPVA
jgi:membrane-associated phospholipid phosphatase